MKCQHNLAFTTALMYGLMFSLLTSFRAALRIRRFSKHSSGTGIPYLASSNSVLIASLEFSVLLGLAAASIQGLTWLLIASLSATFSIHPLGIALGASLLVVALLHLVLWNTRDIAHAILRRSLTSYGFWLGLPCLFFIVMTVLVFH